MVDLEEIWKLRAYIPDPTTPPVLYRNSDAEASSVFRFSAVVEVDGREYGDDGKEDIDIALDTFDGEHGDGLDGDEESESREEATPELVGTGVVEAKFDDDHKEHDELVDDHDPDAGDGGEFVSDASDGSTEEHEKDDVAPFGPLVFVDAHVVADASDAEYDGGEEGIDDVGEEYFAEHSEAGADDGTLAEPADGYFLFFELPVLEERQVGGEAVIVGGHH